jgi:hypothetical protein
MLSGHDGSDTAGLFRWSLNEWCGRGDSFMLAPREARGRMTETLWSTVSEAAKGPNEWCGRGDSNPHDLAATSS